MRLTIAVVFVLSSLLTRGAVADDGAAVEMARAAQAMGAAQAALDHALDKDQPAPIVDAQALRRLRHAGVEMEIARTSYDRGQYRSAARHARRVLTIVGDAWSLVFESAGGR